MVCLRPVSLSSATLTILLGGPVFTCDWWVSQSRLGALDEQWQFLVNKSAEKSQKLKEANKQQNFNTGIKDFDFWLSEVKRLPLHSCYTCTNVRKRKTASE